ncbi:helix-turn-helix transcriptional regulator [Candidatus Nomurabacteria bacterium]|nr:helix-turn-helix transcriptional regulator [Candidatus Nomurabacteria bacterium]
MKQSPLQNNIHSFRTTAGLTQASLAEAVGVTRQTIISIEKGNYEPSVRLALRLSNTLGVTVEELFYETIN